MLKKTYHMIAALALLNLLALGAGIFYLVSKKGLDAERVRKIAAVLRGEDQVDQDGSDESPDDQEARGSGLSVLSKEEERVNDEIRWRNADRYRAQIEQRLKFINVARLDVDRRREEFQRLREKERAELRKRESIAAQPGYQKELDIISALKPKVALKQIMSMSDADAARILFQLENRKVKRIFEAAKMDAELEKLITVRRLIRDIQPTDTDASTNQGGSSAEQ